MSKRIYVILAGGVLFNILFLLYPRGFRPIDATLLKYLVFINAPHAMAAIAALFLNRFRKSLFVLNAGAILLVISNVLLSVSILLEPNAALGLLFLPYYQIPVLLVIIGAESWRCICLDG
jgi:hypothetical protein